MVTIGEESGSGTVSDVEAIVKAGANNLYAATSGGGSYANTLGETSSSTNNVNGRVVNGPSETAATVTAIPAAYNTDSFFDTPTYIGAVSGATDNWYKVWTLSLIHISEPTRP